MDFKLNGIEGRFVAVLETTAYRIAQEALTNIARHAGVARATVRVSVSADKLNVQIEDRGRGFDAEEALARLRSGGLPGMQVRVTLLGGRLTIASRPGVGTQLRQSCRCRVPIRKARRPANEHHDNPGR